VRYGKLITPGFDQDILEGITRDSVLTIARDAGIEVIERPVDKSELLVADEVFLSGTAARVTPVRQVENYPLSNERPITEMIRQKLIAITENREPAYQNWVHKIPLL
jgi:branched-chain amino acid aminotransferase